MEKNTNYYYSARNNAFYPASLEADYMSAGAWPDDVIALEDETYAALLAGQSAGKCIAPDESGQPALSEPPPPTPEALVRGAVAQKDRLMQEARDTILVLERAVKLDMASKEEITLLEQWERYSILLYRVDTDTAPDIDWPQLPA